MSFFYFGDMCMQLQWKFEIRNSEGIFWRIVHLSTSQLQCGLKDEQFSCKMILDFYFYLCLDLIFSISKYQFTPCLSIVNIKKGGQYIKVSTYCPNPPSTEFFFPIYNTLPMSCSYLILTSDQFGFRHCFIGRKHGKNSLD